MNDTRSPVPQRRATGAALIASGGIYFTAEFIAAAAWTDPPYSYTYHFISDLGVHGPSTGFGQYMYSPLAWVMNAGFILFGIAAFAGVVMLGGLPGRRRWAAIVLAALLAADVVRRHPRHGTACGGGVHRLVQRHPAAQHSRLPQPRRIRGTRSRV